MTDDALELAAKALRALDRDALAALLRQHPRLVRDEVNRQGESTLFYDACALDPASLDKPAEAAIAILDLLIDAGVDIKAAPALPDGGRMGPVFFAVRSGAPEVLDHLLARGADPNPGIYAAVYSRPELLATLHRHGADLEQVVHDETPLLHALKNRRFEAVRVLLALGADVNHADASGATALHYAVRQYLAPDVIVLLLARGASATLRSKRGNSPLDLALRMGRNDIAALLGGGKPAAADGAALAQAPHPSKPNVRLRPFVSLDARRFDEALAFYRNLGFVLDIVDDEKTFAQLSLDGTSVMLSAAEAPLANADEALLWRCPRAAFAKIETAITAGALPHTREASDRLWLPEGGGLPLRFVVDDNQQKPTIEPQLTVADLRRAQAFYAVVGFVPLAQTLLANLKSDQLAADLVQVPGNWVCSFPENLADVPADIITLANAQNTFFTAPLAGSTCNGVLKGLPIEYNLEYGGIVATLGRIACDLMAELRVDGRQNPLLISNPTGYNSSLAFTLTVRYGMPKVVLPPDVEPTSATVSLINSARADSYILASFPPSATSLVYALLANQTLGDPARWYLSPTLHSPIFLESLPQGAMVGASGVAQGTSPGADEFRAQFIARWQDQPLDDAYPFYDSGALSTLALQRAAAREGAIRSGAALSSRLIAVTRPGGTPIRWNELGRGLEELRQGREITYVGLSGPLEFDALGNTTGAIANWWNISARGFSDRLEQSNCP